MTTALRCDDVTQVYATPTGGVPVLRGIDLEITAGTVTAIAGASGSGKSTLLRLMAAFERPTAGDIVIGGVSTAGLSDRARRRLRLASIGYVFQIPADNLLPRLTVIEQLRFVGHIRGVDVDPADVRAWLGPDTEELLHRRPAQLSPGQQQEVAVLAAGVGRAGVVIADEPTASLDPQATSRVVQRLQEVAGRGHTVVVASHDPDLLASAHTAVEITGGTVATIARRGERPMRSIDRVGRLHLPAEPRGRARTAVVTGHEDWLLVTFDEPHDPRTD